MYIGDTKVLTQGEEGEARVEADVVYVNGVEQERTIISSTTVREPTTTVMAVGTKEKPKTASKGYFIWPTSSHRINSYFGGRNLWGSYDYHSGLDIHASYGEQIKAADGGTVTFAGWRGQLWQPGHHHPRQRHPDLLRPQLQLPGVGGGEGLSGPAHRAGGQHREQLRPPLPLRGPGGRLRRQSPELPELKKHSRWFCQRLCFCPHWGL